ncbi:MAG: hypothetical protein ABGX83_03100 [Nitrospira sp.]|nr:hypothetical protein [Candidatus Manganitrophaceae bacterium]HIL35600.1 hypothetical protein [Candidatus Manganitrophaceae bacterium]
MGKKWGESFLKSGLPLEHLTLVTLKSLGWECEPKYEYQRVNRSGDLKWFELDLIAHAPSEGEADLTFVIECKYHDEQRFWFFLPCTTVDHQAQYGAMSTGENLQADKNVIHFAPYCPLEKPDQESLLTLAPKTTWGVTVSHDGNREENMAQAALDQLASGFVPFCLERLYHFCGYYPEGVIPVIVTTAKIFCLRPNSQNIKSIRQASAPDDIADELPWTWCYYAPRRILLDHNMKHIDTWKLQHPTWREEHPLH